MRLPPTTRLMLLVALLVVSPARAQVEGSHLALLPLTFEGVAPVVPERARDALTEAATRGGYQLLPTAAVVRAMTQVGMSTDDVSAPLPSAADLFRITVYSGAERGLHCHLYVEGEAYAADLVVASIDGTGPFRVHVVGGASDFLDRLAEAAEGVLPPPQDFDPVAAQRYRGGPSTPTFGAARFPAAGMPPPLPTAAPRLRGPRYGFSLGYEASIGSVQDARFSHHMLRARIDFHLSPNIVLGLVASYVNLDLGATRGSNLLGLVQLEDRLRFHGTGRVLFPIRFAVGYLPFNGPVMRFSGGLRVPVHGAWEIATDLIAPTFYWVPGDRRVAYDVSLEATYRFGPSDG